MLAIPSRDRLERVLKYMLDEKEFLSDYGIRSMSKVHQNDPFMMNVSVIWSHAVVFEFKVKLNCVHVHL